jgi:hypothetical protein
MSLGDDFDPAPSVPYSLRPFRRTCRRSGGRLRGRALLAFPPLFPVDYVLLIK